MKPNILYLHSHDTGRYIQPYGHAVATPHLQRLAEEGVLFRRAFCAAPTCSPSRASLLTGQWPHSSGMLGLAHRGFGLRDKREHLVHTLHQAGYSSAVVGMNHVGMGLANEETGEIGYQQVLGKRNGGAKEVAETAVSYLISSPSEPFFLAVGFSETHRPFLTDQVTAADLRHTQPPPPLPDTPEIRADMAAFKASARVLDESMGKILDALEQNGLAENTLVICTTDHGLAFPGMKCNLTDHGIGVMLTMRGPQFAGGVDCEAMVSQIDIFPTICDVIGVEPPSWLQGHSFLPVVRGEQNAIRDELFAEVTYHAAYEPKRAVRTERFKYIRRFGERELPVLSNCDNSPGKTLWLENGWGEQPLARERLFDLYRD
ncbi:MAG: sulfatase, partial [Chloroflexota bacterium]